MKLRGVSDLIQFLDDLESRSLFYRIEKLRRGAIMVTVTLVGKRIEIEFFDDHIEYSVFSGSEWVLDDQVDLYRMIDADV